MLSCGTVIYHSAEEASPLSAGPLHTPRADLSQAAQASGFLSRVSGSAQANFGILLPALDCSRQPYHAAFRGPDLYFTPRRKEAWVQKGFWQS